MNILLLWESFYDVRMAKDSKILKKFGEVYVGCSKLNPPIPSEIKGIFLLKKPPTSYCLDPIAISSWLRQILNLMKLMKFDLVIAYDIMIGYPAFLACKNKRAPFIFYNNELWKLRQCFIKPQSLFQLLPYFIARITFPLIEKYIMRNAKSICVSNEARDWFIENYNLKKPPSVIKHVVDLELFDKYRNNNNVLLDTNGIKILYSGGFSLGSHLDITDLLKGIALTDKSLNFTLYLTLNQKDVTNKISKKLFKKIKDKVAFLGRQKWHYMPAIIQQSDICVIPTILNPFVTRTDPNKIYESLAGSSLVISTPREHLINLFKKDKLIFWWWEREPEKFAKLLEKIIKKFEKFDERKVRGRRVIENRFNWMVEGKKFERIIHDVLEHKNIE